MRETGNSFAVAVRRGGEIIGRVPKMDKRWVNDHKMPTSV